MERITRYNAATCRMDTVVMCDPQNCGARNHATLNDDRNVQPECDFSIKETLAERAGGAGCSNPLAAWREVTIGIIQP